jgi:ABC-type multidrug transport system fused ATPase/permease subunit
LDNNPQQDQKMVSEDERVKANEFIIRFLQNVMNEGNNELIKLRIKLSVTYWVIIFLSIIMFTIGIALISVPAIAAFSGEIDQMQSLITAGFGILDLSALFLFRPMERIHKMMGDISQIILALNSYQTQVGLRLMELDVTNRPSMGQTAYKVNEAAKESIQLVQDYFEARDNEK